MLFSEHPQIMIIISFLLLSLIKEICKHKKRSIQIKKYWNLQIQKYWNMQIPETKIHIGALVAALLPVLLLLLPLLAPNMIHYPPCCTSLLIIVITVIIMLTTIIIIVIIVLIIIIVPSPNNMTHNFLLHLVLLPFLFFISITLIVTDMVDDRLSEN